MFSIIIPLYNKEKYVERTLKSVFEQTCTQYELIIVNDGSTDSSLNIVRSMTQNRKNIQIIDQENKGVSAARNIGVSKSKYEYVTFLDADDWWDTEFLRKLAELIEFCPQAGVYGSAYYIVKNNKLRRSQNGYPNDYKGYADYIKAYTHQWQMPLTSISVVIRKNVYTALNGFKERLKFGEDFELWIRIAMNEKVAYINEPLAYYNQDVEIEGRALGGKIWTPDSHYIFNLNFLNEAEHTDPNLKILLDGLRVRALLRYYLTASFIERTATELSKVNFNNQPVYFRRIYSLPKLLVRFYFAVKKLLSRIKQKLTLSK